MVSTGPDTTKLSTKGQLILPKAIRQRRQWVAGTKLTVEDTPDGVLIRAAALFPATTIDEVAGALEYHGPPISIEDMNLAIDKEIQARHARGRY